MDITQFTKYNAPISSFDLRNALIGIIRPGRYSGYNVITNTGTRQYTISHDTSSFRSLNNLDLSKADFGVFIMSTGQIYHDNDDVSITIPDTPNIPVRYDALVANVTYAEDSNGNTPNYELLENKYTPLSPTVDITKIPEDLRKIFNLSSEQVLLGYFKVVQINNTITDAGITYYPNYDSLMLGFNQSKEIYQKTFEPKVERSMDYYLNNMLNLDDITDFENTNNYVIPLDNSNEDEYNNKIVSINGYAGNLLKPVIFTLSPLIKRGFRVRFFWDQLSISIQANGSSQELILPSDKSPKTRSQYSMIELICAESAGDGDPISRWIVSGDLS